jgi:hypothetical protein
MERISPQFGHSQASFSTGRQAWVRQPTEERRRIDTKHRTRSVTAAVAVFAGYTALMFVPERGMKSTGGPGIVAFELAGTEVRATQIMDSWGERGRRAARTSLRLDFGYAASEGVSLLAVLKGTRTAVNGRRARRAALTKFGRLAVALGYLGFRGIGVRS